MQLSGEFRCAGGDDEFKLDDGHSVIWFVWFA